MPKMNMLDMVNNILSDMDSELVTSLDDTLESEQVASIIENVYYDMITTRNWPEHQTVVNLTSLADNAKPTTFLIPDSVSKIKHVWYREALGDSYDHNEIMWVDPADFIARTDRNTDTANYTSVVYGGGTLKIANNRYPRYFTTFDDEYIIFDSFDNTEGSTLITGRIRVLASVAPSFTRTDPTFTPDLDAEAFPYFLAESKNQVFSLLKGGVDATIALTARRHKSYIQNDKHKYNPTRRISKYGRY
tara:strand:+ start:312 stop:1052 length:741 start_codon:yes stop_codon:yes gene_type:complete